MRITKEADYALRIMRCLAEYKSLDNQIVDAKTMSETLSIPPRFTLKILRKLMGGGLVKSHKGVNGGYSVAADPSEINMRTIVEVIDGPLTISRCLSEGYECSRMLNDKDKCFFHKVFDNINVIIAEELEKITLDKAL